MGIKFFLGAFLLLIVLIFSVQNAAVVEVRFFGWSFLVSLAVVIFAAMALGFFGGWILLSAAKLKRRHRHGEKSDSPPLP